MRPGNLLAGSEQKKTNFETCMFAKYDWVNCIDIADGTLFPLMYES